MASISTRREVDSAVITCSSNLQDCLVRCMLPAACMVTAFDQAPGCVGWSVYLHVLEMVLPDQSIFPESLDTAYYYDMELSEVGQLWTTTILVALWPPMSRLTHLQWGAPAPHTSCVSMVRSASCNTFSHFTHLLAKI